MKKILLALATFVLTLGTFSQDKYYVATGGDNGDPGTISEPWATWTYGFAQLDPGDTLFIRGGTYYKSNNEAAWQNITITGTVSDTIVITAYPGETPILDLRYVETDEHTECFGLVTTTNYVKFIGLTLQNFYENDGNDFMNFWTMMGNRTVFRNCTIRDGGGRGFRTWEADDFYFYDCDSYRHVDSLSGDLPGNDGYGFSATVLVGDNVYFTNCRAWDCGDDGFTSGGGGHSHYYGCWSFDNGELEGGGSGFKLNGAGTQINTDERTVTNCIAAYNQSAGFTTNDQDYYAATHNIYNNLMYYNGYQPSEKYEYEAGVVVFESQSTQSYEENRTFKNNISYLNESHTVWTGPGTTYYTHDHNTWDGGVTVTGADFVALPANATALVALLSGSRQGDGSLPDLGNYFQLAESSDLINAGTNVGLPYEGTAPDMGPFESEYAGGGGDDFYLIADHTIVDDYEDIPTYYINEVKKMWLSYAGQSHSEAIRDGLDALEALDSRFQVNVTESGTPEAYTTSHLRASRATWGSFYSSTGWTYNYSTYSWFVQSLGISRTKAGISYCDNNSLTLGAIGFGWCWDSEIDSESEFGSYISATKQYYEYVEDEEINTAILFTTGTVDGGEDTYGETGWYKHLGYEQIRDSVENGQSRYLFDYADILCYNNSDQVNTTTWNGHEYPIIHNDNYGGDYTGHIGMVGALRLAKAMWWLLARIAGWDGTSGASTETDILTFVLSEQTGSANINATNHTVSIEVEYGTNVTSLTPTITVSSGATIDPLSGTSQNFTSPFVYTVTAEDEVTEQEWTVTVTVADNTATDILTFVLSEQTGSADINDVNHTVAIEVEYGTNVTVLTPTITVSDGATIDPLSGTSQNFTNPFVYTVTAEDEVTEQEWTVTVTVEDNTATDILTFVLPEQTGAANINDVSHTVGIEVLYGTNVTSLTPTITVSNGATIDPLSGTSQNFTNPFVYTVTAQDEVTEQEWTVTVTVAEAPVDILIISTSGKLIRYDNKVIKW